MVSIGCVFMGRSMVYLWWSRHSGMDSSIVDALAYKNCNGPPAPRILGATIFRLVLVAMHSPTIVKCECRKFLFVFCQLRVPPWCSLLTIGQQTTDIGSTGLYFSLSLPYHTLFLVLNQLGFDLLMFQSSRTSIS